MATSDKHGEKAKYTVHESAHLTQWCYSSKLGNHYTIHNYANWLLGITLNQVHSKVHRTWLESVILFIDTVSDQSQVMVINGLCVM